MDQMRCFIAVELSPQVKAALRDLEDRLKQGQHRFVKWVHPDNIHVTLKFLGSTPVEDLEHIIDALNEVSEHVQPFAVRLGAIGCFPNLQRPEVLWVGLEGDLDKLAALQRQVEEAMQDLGFERESRKFVPHLTLARVKRHASLSDKQAFGQCVHSTDFASNLQIEVDGLSLMESQLTPSGPLYHQLALAELG